MKPRIRVKPGQKLGTVVKLHFDARYGAYTCKCGSYQWELLEDGTVKCACCYRITDNTWTQGKRG